MIGIIDYGAGNLFSLQNSLEAVGANCQIVKSGGEADRLKGLILPGVGAFGAAMQKLQSRNLVEPIRQWIFSGKPFLGICLGMQLLLEGSEESPGISGLGIIPGINRELHCSKVPHMGWNSVEDVGDVNLFAGHYFYFVHSYFAEPQNSSCIAGMTLYESRFAAALQQDNLIAVQFHPEKSGPHGLNFLRKWVSLC